MTGDPLLDGCRAKLRRAETHIKELEEAKSRWLEQEPYEIVHKNNTNRREYSVVLKRAPRPPVDLSVITGEVVAGLRTSLDNLVYALAVHQTKQDPPPREGDIALPILKSKPHDFEATTRQRIGMLDSAAVAAIEKMQPFQVTTRYKESILWLIAELDNINKHRRPHLASMMLGNQITLGCDTENLNVGYLTPPGPFKDHTTLMTFIQTSGNPELKVHFEIAFDICIEERTIVQRRTATELLQGCQEYVESTVDSFEAAFFV